MITDIILSTLSLPFRFLSSLFRFLFGVLGIPFPHFQYARITRPRPPAITRAHDAWIRELEEETGAVCISTHQQRIAQATGAQAGPSTSTLTRTQAGRNAEEKVLPDFMPGTYEEFLKACEREFRVGCIILLSEEHDDVAEFKRSTLTNYEWVKLMQDNNILVWGGDVRYRDAWSASEKLQATTYPFVAFIALQLRHNAGMGASRSSSSATLTVLSRHQGPSIPSTGPTSAATLSDYLTKTLLPRVSPYLERARATQRQRERDRQLREEQDRAFKETADRDRARIEELMRKETEEAEVRRLAAESAKAEETRLLQVAKEREARVTRRLERRRWSRRVLSGALEYNAPGALRIAVSLPNGRVIRKFDPKSTVTDLFSYVDTQLIPDGVSNEDDPTLPPPGSASTNEAIQLQIETERTSADEWWGFKLVLAYPRQELPWTPTGKLSEIPGLQGGGSVVVELVEEVKDPLTAKEDDDGYESEE